MTGIKSMLASKTVWGGVVVVLATLAQFLGYEIGAQDQAQLALILTQAAQIVGGIIAIYGRVTATKRIR